jgi:hypothetical protein
MLGSKGVQYDLNVLDSQAAWKLFCWHAFSGKTEHCPRRLEALARTVVQRCGGLPLALEVTGARVAEETRELSGEVNCWWKEELMEKLPELGDTESPQRGPSVLDVLRSSYDGLPPALKDCFVLLTVWPTNVFGKYVGGDLRSKLGALIPGALSIVQKGKRVLRDLEYRSLIKVDMKFGKESVTLHDLHMELGRSIANEGRVYSASGFGGWNYRCSWSSPVPMVVQHLSLYRSDFFLGAHLSHSPTPAQVNCARWSAQDSSTP